MNTLPIFTEASLLRFSVVIPTYQRRDVVVASVRALASQEFSGNFEVIVVVDGSTDGTAESLRQLDLPFPLTIIEQANQGAATARNQGAATAKGEIVLFLDDDMEAHPLLLAEHDRSYHQGADVVLGHMPLHPESPSNFLSEGINCWAEERVQRLSSPNTQLTLQDLLTGQISLARELFYQIAGFDTDFTQSGSFGNEDIDFGLRLIKGGYKIVFNPQAISWQKYVVTPRQNLKQYHQAGRADVVFARKHPDRSQDIFGLYQPQPLVDRLFWRWLRVPLRWLVLRLIDLGIHRWKVIRRLSFFWVRELEYWEGVREAGGPLKPRPLRVLCYHSISNLADQPIIEDYGVPPAQFRRQLALLEKLGFRFISAKEFLYFIQGKTGLPRHPVLLTFDDCYQDILDAALPLLKERNIPAIAFAVSQRLGGKNDWDKSIGAAQLQLLDAEGLRKLAVSGVAIGSHSRTHPMLNRVSAEQLSEEIKGSVADLEAIELPKPLLFAYPHGEYDQNMKQAMQETGIQAAFTIEPGLVRPGQDAYQVPRLEILREDIGWKFLWKVVLASSLPHPFRPFQNLIARIKRVGRRGVKILKSFT